MRLASLFMAGWLDKVTRWLMIGAFAFAVGFTAWLALELYAEQVRREAVAGVSQAVSEETERAKREAAAEGRRLADEVERAAKDDEARLRREAEAGKGVRDAIKDGGGGVVFGADDDWLRAKRQGAAGR